ncbi:mitochondrial substrate carrier family protein ucpB [Triticum urartu]|nr:mitochondrial substrate carrier family protein ucpB [Triticum urartu]
MTSPMSGDARTPPRGAAPYALYQFGTSGAAVAVATAVTHPLDVIKIRLQMQLAGQRGNLVGMGAIFTQMVEREGPRSLYLGFAPALTRSLIYGGLRLGLYEPCKHVCSYAFGSTNFAFKFASGVVAGALATALTNPMEVLKVRSQMSTSRISTIGVTREIVSEEGVKALWKGVGPAMVRAGCLTASQMATYDEAKQVLLMWTPLEEGFQLHLMSSCIAGTAGTLVTAPIDMIKTRLMLQRESKGARVYRNGFHCAYQVVLTEGVKSLYKGGFATFARLGPQTAITFVACEKLRELAGMSAI